MLGHGRHVGWIAGIDLIAIGARHPGCSAIACPLTREGLAEMVFANPPRVVASGQYRIDTSVLETVSTSSRETDLNLGCAAGCEGSLPLVAARRGS